MRGTLNLLFCPREKIYQKGVHQTNKLLVISQMVEMIIKLLCKISVYKERI